MQENSHPFYRINDFFDTYAAAITNQDSKYLANCHSLPCSFIADDSSAVYTTAAQLEGLINQSKRFYTQYGIVNAIPDIRNKRVISAKIVMVSMNWKYSNASGNIVYECDYQYILKLNEHDNWKAEVVISINEKEIINELLKKAAQ